MTYQDRLRCRYITDPDEYRRCREDRVSINALRPGVAYRLIAKFVPPRGVVVGAEYRITVVGASVEPLIDGQNGDYVRFSWYPETDAVLQQVNCPTVDDCVFTLDEDEARGYREWGYFLEAPARETRPLQIDAVELPVRQTLTQPLRHLQPVG